MKKKEEENTVFCVIPSLSHCAFLLAVKTERESAGVQWGD